MPVRSYSRDTSLVGQSAERMGRSIWNPPNPRSSPSLGCDGRYDHAGSGSYDLDLGGGRGGAGDWLFQHSPSGSARRVVKRTNMAHRASSIRTPSYTARGAVECCPGTCSCSAVEACDILLRWHTNRTLPESVYWCAVASMIEQCSTQKSGLTTPTMKAASVDSPRRCAIDASCRYADLQSRVPFGSVRSMIVHYTTKSGANYERRGGLE